MEDLKEGKQQQFLDVPSSSTSFVRPMSEDVALSLEPLSSAPKVTINILGNSAVCQLSQCWDAANGGAFFGKLPSSNQFKVVVAVWWPLTVQQWKPVFFLTILAVDSLWMTDANQEHNPPQKPT